AERNSSMALLGRIGIACSEGQMNSKRRSLPEPAAFGPDVAAMQFDQLLDDRQSESQPSMSTSCRRISLSKPFENIRQKIRCDAFTGISYADFHVWVEALKPHVDLSVLGGEFNGIVKEVPENLLKAIWIA